MLIRVLRAFGIDGVPPHRASLGFPEAMVRTSDYLTHPVFHMNRAESEMMRYMRRLFGPRPCAGPGDDSAWVLHHEAERGGRDDADHLARVWHAAPLCPGRSGGLGYHEAIADL